MRAVLTAALLAVPQAGNAVFCDLTKTCTVFNVSRVCDVLCTAGVNCNVGASDDVCSVCVDITGASTNNQPCNFDSQCTTSPFLFCDGEGDGFVSVCGTTSADSISGSGNADWLCGAGGNDTINGNGGNDGINGGDGNDTINAGGGDDLVEGGAGMDTMEGSTGDDDIRGNLSTNHTLNDGGNTIFGDAGDDFIAGSGGDDEIFGGADDDFIFAQGGRDVTKAGAGNDTVFENYGGAAPDEVFGGIICGEEGDDGITAVGAGHRCVDAGPGQVVSGSEVDCNYINLPNTNDDHDVATQRNCANPTNFSATRHPSCGCDCD
jgi:Ca2+-binding RTX toxin-like protein